MQVAGYQLGVKLGGGAFGATYAATRADSDEAFVVKTIAIRGLSDWRPVERLEREALVLQSLDHPGVVRFVGAFEASVEAGEEDDAAQDDGPQFFVVSRRVAGEPLAAKIERRVRWTEEQARELLEELLQTLLYLHELSPRVVHRDIKPGNIVLTEEGRPVLVDFGSVLDLSSRGADGGPTFAGTAGYMAPEQAMGNVDPRSDLYGLGTTMLHVLTHQHPADLPRHGLRFDIRDRVGVSDQLHSVLMRLVEPDPDARFPSARVALDALRTPPRAAPAVALAAVSGVSAVANAPTRALAVRPPSAVPAAAPRLPTPDLAQLFVPARTLFAGPASAPVLAYGSMGILAGWFMAALTSAFVLSPLLFVAMPAFAMLAGIRLNGIRERQRRLRAGTLYRSGKSTVGRLTWGWFNPHSTSLRYQYVVGNHVFGGFLETTDLVRSRLLRYKDPVHVFYDPRDPAVHLAVLDYELAQLQTPAA